jgi:hypothetical protein
MRHHANSRSSSQLTHPHDLIIPALMYWFSDRKDGSGPVTAISLNSVFCQ